MYLDMIHKCPVFYLRLQRFELLITVLKLF